MQVTTIGLDLAKNVFQVHGITDAGEVAFNRSLRRAQVLTNKMSICILAAGFSRILVSYLYCTNSTEPTQ